MSLESILSEINNNLNANLCLLPPTDKKIHRLSRNNDNKKPLWIVGHEFIHSKNTYSVYIYGDFKTGQEFKTTSWEGDGSSSQFKKKYNEETKRIRQEIEEEKQTQNYNCQIKCQDIFYLLPQESEVHEYLSKKEINSNFTARIGKGNSLNIPIYNFDEDKRIILVGIQYIFHNENLDGFEKRFSSGIRLNSSFFLMSNFNMRTIDHAYVCEGFATCSTIQMAHPEASIIGCITAGNLINVIKNIREYNPEIKITICCDNDHETKVKTKKNPGLDSAYRAQKNFPNICLKIPESESNCSDWNDIYIIKDIDYVREKTLSSIEDFINVEILGHDNNEKIFFFIEQTLSVVHLTKSNLKADSFVFMAKSSYWGKLYGWKYDKEGGITNKPDWDKVIDDVCEIARAKGHFSWDNVRGFGLWRDENRIVQHVGKSLIVNDQDIPLTSFDSKFRYQSFPEIKITKEAPKPTELIDACKMINFTTDGQYAIICGWIVTANIFGILNWRPHVWINAPFASGKSTILKWISKSIFNCLYLTDSTAAGIKQTLKIDQRAIIFDESEPDGEQSKNRMASILDLARYCSSPDKMEVIRGTVNGNSQRQNINTVFCFASIINSLEAKSDLSRYFQLSLKSLEEQKPEEYQAMINAWNKVDALKIYSWATQNCEKIIERTEMAHKTIRTMGIDSRMADQFHGIVGAFSLLSGMDIADVVKLIELKKEKEEEMESETDVMWQKIMSAIYDTSQNKDTIGLLLEKTMKMSITASESNRRILSIYGIKILSDGKIAIQVNNENLIKIINNKFYANSLRSGASRHFNLINRNLSHKFGYSVAKCLVIELKFNE